MEQPFRSVPRQLVATPSATGVGAEQAPFRAQPIRLQSQWAVPSRRRLPLLIIDVTPSSRAGDLASIQERVQRVFLQLKVVAD